MKKTCILLLISCIVGIDCFADEQRINSKFESSNGEYTIHYNKKKWIVTNKSGSTLYKIPDQGFSSMTIFVSNSGQNVVIIDDFIEHHTIGNRTALWIYNHGELKSSYKLTEIVKDTCNISLSVWHTTWCINDYGLTNDEKEFSLSTYEFFEYSFDLETGQILSNKRPGTFDIETSIVYGEFRKGNGEQATMKILRYIEGEKQPDNKITFTTKYFGAGLWTQALMIRNGIDITPDKYRNGILINSMCVSE